MTAQPTQKKKRSFITTIGLFIIALCCICMVIAAISEAINPTQTPQETSSFVETPSIETQLKITSTPMPPAATLIPIEELRARIITSLGDSNRDRPRLTSFDWSETDKSLIIEWTINDNFTSNMIMVGTQTDITDMLKIISQSGLLPDYQFVTFVGTFSLRDAYGNVSEERVVTASYNKSTVDKINWPNFLYTDIFTIADLKGIDPVMTAP